MMLVWFLALSFRIPAAVALDRHYFIAALDIDWNYAPTGHNLVTDDNKKSREKIETRKDRIGSIYKKAIYRGYTDNTFTQPIPVPEWAGLLGPPIKAEVGDIVYIHFQNMATGSNFSVHPHGFLYNKIHEGALYIDGTSGNEKLEDAVPPGGTATYVWKIGDEHAPTNDDDNCAAYTYHSHTRAPKDVDTGLVGVAVLCKKGTLHTDGRRKDVDKEFYLYADVTDENNSWYSDQNLHKCRNYTACKSLKDKKCMKFLQSNRMPHINGYVYGNLRDFIACEGEKVVWYFMSINRATHTVQALGQTMIIERKRTDTAVLFPASVYSGYMIPSNPGRWLLYCRNLNHYDGGMSSFLTVTKYSPSCAGLPVIPPVTNPTLTRTYFLAIEEVLWDYAPGFDNNKTIVVSKFLNRGKQRIGSVYKKAMYIEYTDGTFTVQKARNIRHMHYGLAGPPIKAQVGERVIVVVLNKASRHFSFLANGVSMTKENEGAYYKNARLGKHMNGAIIKPGAVRTYEFDVTKHSAPTPWNEDCITYMYHSAVDITRDIYAGLFGPLLVCKPGTLALDGSQNGVDREFFVNWMVIDENLSWYIDDNIARFTSQMAVNKTDQKFKTSNKIRAINGRTFGTLDGLQMCTGENVKWHMYGLGGQVDHHHFSFEGNNFKFDSRNLDTASVFPGVGHSVNMIPDQTGHLLLRDGQLGFESEGMYAWYNVQSCKKKITLNYPTQRVKHRRGMVRRYYIGVIERSWDYAEAKIDPIDGSDLLNPKHKGYTYVRSDPPFLGSVYHKAMYVEFTDNTFLKMKQRTPEERHLGLLGPFIRGNAGDTIEIVLKNFASHPYNIVPRNVIFNDGSPITNAPLTMPGETRVYAYVIPKRSGPTLNQPNCVGSLYVSRVAPLNDTHSGLVGPFVVCKPGTLDTFGRRTDNIKKEFATGYIIFDESKSNYRNLNFGLITPNSLKNPDFIESNLYHSINGYIYGNLKGLIFSEGEHSAWYVFGLGSVQDIHTVHYHGQLYLRKTSLSLKRDVLEVFAGTYETVEMIGYNPGTWLFHCHVAPHAMEGMEASYTVLPQNGQLEPGQGRYIQGYGQRSRFVQRGHRGCCGHQHSGRRLRVRSRRRQRRRWRN
ncbi:ferroxidase HEPHL1-like [Mercenaria mercenaria]|uniref:ferroxidase HEPHL1-like n=1 Tax=Mercenaria mercenaria TaxID=6596 RepID=UPI00234F0910|nr:ferroxidase HEPHL1-like [Mercenaria mercenaria]